MSNVRPIGYTDSGEPVWPVTSDPEQDCDHAYGWVCNETGEHTNHPWLEVNDILSNVYATLSEREDGGAYESLPARTLRANIYMALAMFDTEATDPCIRCDHPVRSHDEAFPAPCLVTNCECGWYDNGECDDCFRTDGTHNPDVEH
jgi:hypothetical protein